MSTHRKRDDRKLELPTVDWLERQSNPEKFFADLSFALSEFGFMVLTNAPGLDDEFQHRAFREVRGFFDAPMDIKKTAHISNTPYFRGYTLPTPADRGHGQVIENFQYGFEQEPVCAYDDASQPIHRRLFRGPNTWPQSTELSGFRPLIEEMNSIYHRLTHLLGEAIVESLGEDPAAFREYFDFDEPDLAASLNHNFSMDVFDETAKRIGKAKQVGVDSNQELVLVVSDVNGNDINIKWNRIGTVGEVIFLGKSGNCLLYTSPSPRDS